MELNGKCLSKAHLRLLGINYYIHPHIYSKMREPLKAAEVSQSSFEEVALTLGTDISSGLNSTEAESRLRSYGKNAIEPEKNMGFLGVFVREFREPMILLLVIIAILYSILGEPRDAITIVVVVMLVVGIETYNVNKARASINALRDLRMPVARVLRGGSTREMKTESIVPGDIVFLYSGDLVPADGRLVESHTLKVDESSLTGESFYVLKDADSIPKSGLIAELTNIVFSGTMVVQGSGKFIATATGKNTELGTIASLTEKEGSKKTPLQDSLSRLITVLASMAVIFSVIVPLMGYLEGQAISDMILTGLSMAFATVPEELPVIISITLAIGAFSLSKHKAVVKDLRAAETLGSVSVIATDKTGTLTENKMSVANVYFDPSTVGLGLQPDFMDEAAILATGTLNFSKDSETSRRDPMETAVYNYFISKRPTNTNIAKKYRLLEEFGFDNKLKLSSYIYENLDQEIFIFTSGAPEAILNRIDNSGNSNSSGNALKEDLAALVLEEVEEISSRGERVIGVAYKKLEKSSTERNDVECTLNYLGLISFIDPPREEVKNSILACQNAGIKVIMLTGDHPRTARAIADKVGINSAGAVLTGNELARMDDSTLKRQLDRVSVFARITSEDKFRIVKLLQEKGETVAVTGDGVNDSPALKRAEIGISMGIRGTAVAREASDMILLDDNFSTIVEAVHEGREILYTLKKSIKYEISIKLSLVMILFAPLIVSIPFPFSPIQIIILELLLDVAALGGFLYEREESGIMTTRMKNAKSSFINASTLAYVTLTSLAIAGAVFGIYFYLVQTSGDLERSQTAAFAAWVIAQLFLAQNLRTEREPVSVKGFFSNKVVLIWGILVFITLFIITIFPSLQLILHTADLTAFDWVLVIAGTAAATFWMEAVKIWHYYSGKHRYKGL